MKYLKLEIQIPRSQFNSLKVTKPEVSEFDPMQSHEVELLTHLILEKNIHRLLVDLMFEPD